MQGKGGRVNEGQSLQQRVEADEAPVGTAAANHHGAETGWTKNTVITMLSRLEAKGAVRCQEGGRAKLYYPALDRRDAARAETESFLGRVYGGSVGSMMSAMVDSRQLTAEDIAELSAILEKAGGGES